MFLQKTQILFFLVAGTLGFAIEAITIYAAVNILLIDPYTPRLISYPIASFVTWYINRRFGFKIVKKPKCSEFFRFIHSNILAQLANLSLYFFLISLSSTLAQHAILMLMVATFVSMLVSLFMYKNYVFV